MSLGISFADYQEASRATAVYPRTTIPDALTYVLLGLCGEAGETANKYKKVLRDKGGVIGEEEQKQLADELGDVLWYIAQIATELKLDLGKIAEMNLHKLATRKTKGTLQGSGDKR